MREQILARLLQIEREERVRILYACESGSRAWGFPSADSDYDVRFIYLHPADWYLAVDLEDKRDVIEQPINDELDISGWDLRKALRLMRKSNPPLLEWLGSPITYLSRPAALERLKALAGECYSPTSCLHHYLHMAQGNYREYLRGETVRVKKYFYVLRPLLAINWIEAGLGIVPMEFGVLVERLIKQPALRREIELLLERKQSGSELDRGPRIPAISDFIESELRRLEAASIAPREPAPSFDKLNELFRTLLIEAA